MDQNKQKFKVHNKIVFKPRHSKFNIITHSKFNIFLNSLDFCNLIKFLLFIFKIEVFFFVFFPKVQNGSLLTHNKN